MIKIYKIKCLLLVLLFFPLFGGEFCLLLVEAQDTGIVREHRNTRKSGYGPLIQTTTRKEEYEGIVFCGGLSTKISAAHSSKAFENIRLALVFITSGSYRGSGVIWEMKEKEIVIATCGHLLDKTIRGCSVEFLSGVRAQADGILLSDTYDLCFLTIPIEELGYEEALNLRQVKRDIQAGLTLEQGSNVFNAGSADGTAENFYEGSVAGVSWFVEEFSTNMLYSFCYAKPGMSGGGTFDSRGYYLGMISGGNGFDETMSLPLASMEEEYKKLMK